MKYDRIRQKYGIDRISHDAFLKISAFQLFRLEIERRKYDATCVCVCCVSTTLQF